MSSCPSPPRTPNPTPQHLHSRRPFFSLHFTTAFVSGDLFVELMAVSYKCKTMIIVIALVVLDALVIELVVLDDLVGFLVELISVLVSCCFLLVATNNFNSVMCPELLAQQSERLH